MRHESLYLADIVEAADYIAEFIEGTDFQGFQKSELLRSAVVQKLAVIGEAAARVSEELMTRHSGGALSTDHIVREQVVAILAAESGCSGNEKPG